MRKIILVIIAVLVLGGVALAINHKSSNNTPAPANQSTAPSSTGSKNSATGQVRMTNMLFTPSQISVAVGGTVTWTNDDNVAHTVTDDLSNVGGPNSGDVQPGSTYSFKFTKKGSYQYHCTIHPSMRATIVVS